MILRQISCSVNFCENEFKEKFPNQGFPDWGHVGGLQATVETPMGKHVVDTFYICPEHMEHLKSFIQGEVDTGKKLIHIPKMKTNLRI